MFKLLPWKFILRRAAKSYGIIDPLMLMARIRSFAQPSEIQEPLELLRAGIIFHARGLVNTKAIQHNMDWVWPFWVERQFNPEDPAFIPRGFSFSHINLTHRNWTAVGLPNAPVFPIIDPRGLVTPFHDGWSLDFWIINRDGAQLIPSQTEEALQELVLEDGLAVRTRVGGDGMRLSHEVAVEVDGGHQLRLAVHLNAEADRESYLAVTVRPYNPEGIQFIESISVPESADRFEVNEEAEVRFSESADGFSMAKYEDGDVYHSLSEDSSARRVDCEVGMATAAALFRLRPNAPRRLCVQVPLAAEVKRAARPPRPEDWAVRWTEATSGTAVLRVNDERMQFLYDAAVRTMLLLSADDLFPGPYTYRRFWFRDACLMLKALLVLGCRKRARRIIDGFLARQTHAGYFASQEGEWDSNGQVLWILNEYERHAHERLGNDFAMAAMKAVGWLNRKRLPKAPSSRHAGLLPPGFSAEHLGPNDYYYWDDFWGEAGLRAAASMLERGGQPDRAREAAASAEDFRESIAASFDRIPRERCQGAWPASPYRRMDAGAVGSLVADYPLQLFPPGEPRIMATVEHLMVHCWQRGGFYQEMIHSGVNAYLTLDIAQTLLRHGDGRYGDLIDAVAELASPTGQWPEAIHPRTLGGCMGDGQHGWAAAEWIMMMRNCFVREELSEGKLIVGSGLLPCWLDQDGELSFGPTATPWGSVTVRLLPQKGRTSLSMEAHWHEGPPRVEARLPGHRHLAVSDFDRTHELERIES